MFILWPLYPPDPLNILIITDNFLAWWLWWYFIVDDCIKFYALFIGYTTTITMNHWTDLLPCNFKLHTGDLIRKYFVDITIQARVIFQPGILWLLANPFLCETLPPDIISHPLVFQYIPWSTHTKTLFSPMNWIYILMLRSEKWLSSMWILGGVWTFVIPWFIKGVLRSYIVQVYRKLQLL